jgi:hypothetical protein
MPQTCLPEYGPEPDPQVAWRTGVDARDRGPPNTYHEWRFQVAVYHPFTMRRIQSIQNLPTYSSAFSNGSGPHR